MRDEVLKEIGVSFAGAVGGASSCSREEHEASCASSYRELLSLIFAGFRLGVAIVGDVRAL